MAIILKVLSFTIWLVIMGVLIVASHRLYQVSSFSRAKVSWEKPADKVKGKEYLKKSQ